MDDRTIFWSKPRCVALDAHMNRTFEGLQGSVMYQRTHTTKPTTDSPRLKRIFRNIRQGIPPFGYSEEESSRDKNMH
jgi:hypothetical protein